MTASLRVLKIVRRLKRHSRTVYQLAEEHAVDVKTIRRDLVVIRKAGFRLLVREQGSGRKSYRLA